MAKSKKMDAMRLTTPQEVWDYYNVVNGLPTEEVEEDVVEWVNPILNRYDEEDIRYVLNAHQGIDKMVVFDMGYFDTVLENRKDKEELAKSKPQGVAMTDYAMNIITDALLNSVKETKGEDLVKWAKDTLYSEFGPITRQINYVKPDGTKLKGVIHKKFDEISELSGMGENVLLIGPAGTGKSFLAKQLADALGAHYYKINSPQQAYEWEGFVDAKGKLVDTPFTLFARDKELSVLDIEEIDNMNPSVGVKINDSLDSKVVHLPNGEVLDFSENHIFVASANTWGTGATADYVGRNQLDAATLNRWQPVLIDYDTTIEEAMCPDTEMLGFLRDFRKQINNNGIHHIVSYRNIKSTYNWITNYPDRNIEDVLKTTLIRNLEPNDLSTIAYKLKDNKYAEIIKRLANC